jgi:hypothetical protein
MRALGAISSQAEIAHSARLVWNTTAQRKTGYLNFLQNVLVIIIITKKYIHIIYYYIFFSFFFFLTQGGRRPIALYWPAAPESG